MGVVTTAFTRQRLKRKWQEVMHYCKPRFVCLCSVFTVFAHGDSRATFPTVRFHQKTMTTLLKQSPLRSFLFFKGQAVGLLVTGQYLPILVRFLGACYSAHVFCVTVKNIKNGWARQSSTPY